MSDTPHGAGGLASILERIGVGMSEASGLVAALARDGRTFEQVARDRALEAEG